MTISFAQALERTDGTAATAVPASAAAHLVVRDLEKAYGPVRKALSDVSFELSAGFVGLLGPNGAGKSTLMSCLAGILSWDKGQVVISGADAERHPGRCRRNVGYMPERIDFPREMRVEDYLGFVAGPAKRIPRKERAQAVETALERTGLGPSRRRLVGNLSKGWRQRVGLAQALLGDPPVVILDEPTAGLDPLNLLEIRPALVEYALDHVLLLSTHTLAEARLLCDRLLVLRAGKLIYDGPTSGLGAGGNRHMRIRVTERDGKEIGIALKQAGAHVVRNISSREAVVELADDEAAADLTGQLVAAGWRLAALEPTADELEDAFRSAVAADEVWRTPLEAS